MVMIIQLREKNSNINLRALENSVFCVTLKSKIV